MWWGAGAAEQQHRRYASRRPGPRPAPWVAPLPRTPPPHSPAPRPPRPAPARWRPTRLAGTACLWPPPPYGTAAAACRSTARTSTSPRCGSSSGRLRGGWVCGGKEDAGGCGETRETGRRAHGMGQSASACRHPCPVTSPSPAHTCRPVQARAVAHPAPLAARWASSVVAATPLPPAGGRRRHTRISGPANTCSTRLPAPARAAWRHHAPHRGDAAAVGGAAHRRRLRDVAAVGGAVGAAHHHHAVRVPGRQRPVCMGKWRVRGVNEMRIRAPGRQAARSAQRGVACPRPCARTRAAAEADHIALRRLRSVHKGQGWVGHIHDLRCGSQRRGRWAGTSAAAAAACGRPPGAAAGRAPAPALGCLPPHLDRLGLRGAGQEGQECEAESNQRVPAALPPPMPIHRVGDRWRCSSSVTSPCDACQPGPAALLRQAVRSPGPTRPLLSHSACTSPATTCERRQAERDPPPLLLPWAMSAALHAASTAAPCSTSSRQCMAVAPSSRRLAGKSVGARRPAAQIADRGERGGLAHAWVAWWGAMQG